jgi:hypothetical protein
MVDTEEPELSTCIGISRLAAPVPRRDAAFSGHEATEPAGTKACAAKGHVERAKPAAMEELVLGAMSASQQLQSYDCD